MTAPSTPNSVVGANAPTPKGNASVGNTLDQLQEDQDELALQSLLTAAVTSSSSALIRSTSPTGAYTMSGGMSNNSGDPMDSLRGVSDLLDGSESSLLALDTSTGSDALAASMPISGGGSSNNSGNNMSNVQMNNLGMQQQGANMGNKSSCQMGGGGGVLAGGSMDNTYMQNRIFVFSTQMANKGAEMVINGHFLSIIAYHCSQPETKKILDVSMVDIKLNTS